MALPAPYYKKVGEVSSCFAELICFCIKGYSMANLPDIVQLFSELNKIEETNFD